MTDAQIVIDGYIECALWSSLDDDQEPLDARFGQGDLTDGAVVQIATEVKDFLAYCEREGLDLSGIADGQIGHDFWLTRNRHGAGFWDRGLGELGDKLTAIAKTYGESTLYDLDGWVYVL